jgi:hypothetical protein
MNIVPNTRFTEVVDEVNLLLAVGRYADPFDLKLRQIKREAEKVRDAEPAEGWALLSCVHSILGEAAEVDRCFQASRRLAKIPVAIENYMANLGNLGYFSRAHEVFLEEGHPTKGMLSTLGEVGFRSGSIHAFVSYYQLAKEMKQDLAALPIDDALKAASILSRAGVSDSQIAKHLDAVGSVLRRHSIFFHGDAQVRIADVDGVYSGVTYVFNLQLNSDEVFDLNLELANEEEAMGIERNVAFDAMFLPL